jgi:anti-sigma regulatory factor (Ser/Thr protein kinase)
MIMAAHRANTQTACHKMPGNPIQAMTERQTRHGLTVHTTGCDDSRLQKVIGNGAASHYPSGHGHAGCSANPWNHAGFGRWQQASKLELGPLPSAVPCARLHAKHIFREWRLAHVADDAELIVSELMTNALNATKAPRDYQPITLRLLASREYLLIQVWDALTAAPVPRPHAIDSETGRGLEIVTLLCDRWGYYHPPEGGKVTWAALVTGAAPGTAQGAGT